MIDTEVPQEMLLDGARMSLAALTAGTMGFLKEKGIPVKEFVDYVGQTFEESLTDLADDPVEKVMEHLLALEIMPMGVEVLDTKSGRNKAEVVVSTLPGKKLLARFGTTPRELLSGFHVSPKEYESMLDMYVPAAKAIGLRFTHAVVDGKEVLTIERPAKKA